MKNSRLDLQSKLNKTLSPIEALKYTIYALILFFVLYGFILYFKDIPLCLLSNNEDIIKTIKSNIPLYMPLIFLGFAIISGYCFLKSKNLIIYYLFFTFLTALSLSFIDMHQQTVKIAENLDNITHYHLIAIKTLSIFIMAASVILNIYAAKLIGSFKDDSNNTANP